MANTTTAQSPDTRREEYTIALPQWTQTEDAAAGEAVVKKKEDLYLPRPNAADDDDENRERYKAYLRRAVYYNVTGRTVRALVGLGFGKFPTIQMPAGTDYAITDINGGGITLAQHAQRSLSQVLLTGRAGLFVDMPTKDPRGVDRSLADEGQGGIRPTITYYPASDVINWRTIRRAGRTMLGLVVLREQAEFMDGFRTELRTQYRVLRLEGSKYTVELWEHTLPKGAQPSVWRVQKKVTPTLGNGAPLTEIPFQFIGAHNNDWEIDPGPMYDIGSLNLAHYRNSADYEESSYLVGQPQYWVMGVSQDWLTAWKDAGIYFGSRAIGAGPPGASVTLHQPDPNTMARDAMKEKERQMAALGAYLIQEGSAAKTATQQDSEDTVAHSVLSLCCDNVSSAYTQALTWFGQFANAAGTAEFKIPTEFATRRIDATVLSALLQMVQSGKLPLSDFWRKLRNVGLIDSTKTDDDIREEIEADAPPDEQTELDEEDDTRQVS